MTVGVTASDENVWLPDPDVPTRYSTRDDHAERAALARLQKSGFSTPDAQGRLLLYGQNAVLNFFAREFPRLQREWTVTLEERLEQSTAKNLERIEPRFQITPSGVQWFDLGVVFSSAGGETFSPADIQRLLLSGQKSHEIEEWQNGGDRHRRWWKSCRKYCWIARLSSTRKVIASAFTTRPAFSKPPCASTANGSVQAVRQLMARTRGQTER